MTSMTIYTFSVVATNYIGRGKAGVVMIITPDTIYVYIYVCVRTCMRACMTLCVKYVCIFISEELSN